MAVGAVGATGLPATDRVKTGATHAQAAFHVGRLQLRACKYNIIKITLFRGFPEVACFFISGVGDWATEERSGAVSVVSRGGGFCFWGGGRGDWVTGRRSGCGANQRCGWVKSAAVAGSRRCFGWELHGCTLAYATYNKKLRCFGDFRNGTFFLSGLGFLWRLGGRRIVAFSGQGVG